MMFLLDIDIDTSTNEQKKKMTMHQEKNVYLKNQYLFY